MDLFDNLALGFGVDFTAPLRFRTGNATTTPNARLSNKSLVWVLLQYTE